jgi:hypothetical protein
VSFRCALLLVAPLLWTACGTAVPDVPADQPVSYAAHIEPLIVARCLGCHEAEDPEADLVLEPGQGYGDLVGRPSVQQPSMELVSPGDPDASYLWLKLQHTAPHGKGMPRTLTGSKKLRLDELELYRRWIEGGARP